jgi:protease-4
MKRLPHLIIIATILLIGGCVHVDVPLLQPVAELHEKTIEGEGNAKMLLIDIEGFISEKGKSGAFKENPSMVADVREALLKAEKDPDVAGIVLRINSPGGTVAASDIIRHELLAFKEKKKVPVYASITGIGASGAYYIATAADEIDAHPTAITGSIGVLLMHFNVEGLLSKIGVSEKTEKSADKKDILSPFRPTTPEEEKIIQDIIDSLHQRFVNNILARPGNTLTKSEVEKLADGRVYSAEQAYRDKLIDRVCYLDETIAAMEKKLNLKEARIVTYYRAGSYRGTIYSTAQSASPQMFNLLNISADGLRLLEGTEFMYLWRP